MERKIENWVKEIVRGKLWRKPLISFCNAESTEILPKIIPNHLTAEDVLPNAKSVIVYFIPFTEDVVKSNANGKRPSKLWALAYIETNKLIEFINDYLSKKLENLGFRCAKIEPTHNFDENSLMSYWSHKHIAYFAGLGTFGVHTMLITEKGCCGRLGSLITDAELKYGEIIGEELCIHKKGKKCLECVEKCPVNALKENYFDRRKCYEFLIKNSRIYGFFADVCGKCACGVPCSKEISNSHKDL